MHVLKLFVELKVLNHLANVVESNHQLRRLVYKEFLGCDLHENGLARLAFYSEDLFSLAVASLRQNFSQALIARLKSQRIYSSIMLALCECSAFCIKGLLLIQLENPGDRRILEMNIKKVILAFLQNQNCIVFLFKELESRLVLALGVLHFDHKRRNALHLDVVERDHAYSQQNIVLQQSGHFRAIFVDFQVACLRL